MGTLTKTLLVAAGGLLFSAGAALARPAVVVTDLNLRAGASVYAPVILTMPRGARVEIYDCGAGWCTVNWRGYQGYASASYLAPLGYAPPRYYPPSPPPYYYYDYDRDDYRDRGRSKRHRDDDRDRYRGRDHDRDDGRKGRDRDRDNDDNNNKRHGRKGDGDGGLKKPNDEPDRVEKMRDNPKGRGLD